MPVIALTREMASGGREVAELLASQLGLTIILHELIAQNLAERMRVPAAAIHRRFEGGATLRERWGVSGQRLVHQTTDEILTLAERGNLIIRGWGASVILRDVPHVVRVRVCAPLALRRARLLERGTFTRASAREALERNDAAHRSTLKTAFGVDREDPTLYDIVLNTERLSFQTCADEIRRLVESPEFMDTDQTRAALRDRVLEARVRAALHERFNVGTGFADLEVKATDGSIVVKGRALHPGLATEAAAMAGSIPGVVAVDKQVEIVKPGRLFLARRSPRH